MKQRMSGNQRGVAIVEFALVLPFLLVLMFIAVEFGRALHQYSVISRSVRDAARHLSARQAPSFDAEARNLVVYGTPTAGSSPLVPGLATTMVQISRTTTGSAPVISVLTVTVNGFTFQSMFTSAFGLSFGPIPFTSISATMRVNA